MFSWCSFSRFQLLEGKFYWGERLSQFMQKRMEECYDGLLDPTYKTAFRKLEPIFSLLYKFALITVIKSIATILLHEAMDFKSFEIKNFIWKNSKWKMTQKVPLRPSTISW